MDRDENTGCYQLRRGKPGFRISELARALDRRPASAELFEGLDQLLA